MTEVYKITSMKELFQLKRENETEISNLKGQLRAIDKKWEVVSLFLGVGAGLSFMTVAGGLGCAAFGIAIGTVNLLKLAAGVSLFALGLLILVSSIFSYCYPKKSLTERLCECENFSCKVSSRMKDLKGKNEVYRVLAGTFAALGIFSFGLLGLKLLGDMPDAINA